MKLVCLCPTYGRPQELLENSLACFLHQDYSAADRRLIMLDDLGNVAEQQGDGWEVHSTPERFPSLPHKYARLLELAGDDWDAAIVWDDDDIYLPWHLSAHAAALEDHEWSHPSLVYSLCGAKDGVPVIEPAAGRFHGAMAVRRDALERVGGWLGVMLAGEERRADFDQRLLGALSGSEPGGDPLTQVPVPSYVYGWGRSRHCSGQMSHAADMSWYSRHAGQAASRIQILKPLFDATTELLLRQAAI